MYHQALSLFVLLAVLVVGGLPGTWSVQAANDQAPPSSINGQQISGRPIERDTGSVQQAPISTGDGSWLWRNPVPQGNLLRGVHCVSEHDCLIVGAAGTMLRTHDGGATWLASPALTGNHQWRTELAAPDHHTQLEPVVRYHLPELSCLHSGGFGTGIVDYQWRPGMARAVSRCL